MPALIRRRSGFTLIELLVVIGIIAVLAAGVFVALDPVKRFADSRNSRRWNDVNSILTAIHQYIVDNNGSLPTGLTANNTEVQLGTCPSGGATACASASAACVNLATPLAKYLKSLPLDPDGGSAATTKYSVTVDTNNLVTVKACAAESGASITVTR